MRQWLSRWRLRHGVVALLAGLLTSTGLPTFAASPILPPLTSVSGSPSLPGKFVWADLVTYDVPAARKFYAGLFGWRFQVLGEYSIALNNERPLCGMFQRPRPTGQTAQPRWFGYISSRNVERAKKQVVKWGGRVVSPPQKFPKRGEQALFADPEGALFGVIKSSSGDPEDFLAEPGDWVWVQLLSRDARKAADFYRAVAGYEVVENSEKNRLSDYVLTSEGYARATVRTIPESRKEVAPTWLPFVRVVNIGDAIAKAKELGGKVLIEPRPQLQDGKVAVVADPTGAAVGVMEWNPVSLKGAR